MILIIYFVPVLIGAICLPVYCGYRSKTDPSDDEEGDIVCIVGAILFWPISLSLLTVWLIGNGLFLLGTSFAEKRVSAVTDPHILAAQAEIEAILGDK